MTRRVSAGLAAMLLIAACGKKQPAPKQSGQMSGMQGMSMRSDSMMPMMRAHLDSLVATPPQFVGGMLPRHEELASQMLDAMGADMTAMGMKADSAWKALADSVKRDLADLPTLSGQRLASRLPAHVDRIRRLMTMHQGMMRHAM